MDKQHMSITRSFLWANLWLCKALTRKAKKQSWLNYSTMLPIHLTIRTRINQSVWMPVFWWYMVTVLRVLHIFSEPAEITSRLSPLGIHDGRHELILRRPLTHHSAPENTHVNERVWSPQEFSGRVRIGEVSKNISSNHSVESWNPQHSDKKEHKPTVPF